MKKLIVALALAGCFSGMASAHEAGEFFMRAGTATVRPTEGSGSATGSGGGCTTSGFGGSSDSGATIVTEIGCDGAGISTT